MDESHGGGPPLPTLGWVEDGEFNVLDTLILQPFMDFLIRSWANDFSTEDGERLRNLKCLLPSSRVVPRQVPIVKEFDKNWPDD